MNARSIEGWYEGAGGTRLFYRRWDPSGTPGATIALLHGLGEHSGAYEGAVMPFVETGCRVVACDLRGHGRSPGQRGHIFSFDEFRGDVDRFLIAPRGDGGPLFLFGHSLGGVIALDRVLRRPAPLAGLILSAPVLAPAVVSPFVWFLARCLDRVIPRFSLPVLRAAQTASNSSKTTDEKDPLLHSFGSARLGMEVRRTLDRIRVGIPSLALSTLDFHSEGDAIASVEGSQMLAARAPAGIVTLKIFSGETHELLNSKEHKDEVIRLVTGWMAERKKGKANLIEDFL